MKNIRVRRCKEAETITGKSAATVWRYFKILADTRYIMAEGSTNNIVQSKNSILLIVRSLCDATWAPMVLQR